MGSRLRGTEAIHSKSWQEFHNLAILAGRGDEMAKKKSLALGLMSGTSMDGIDAVLGAYSASGDDTVVHIQRAYPSRLRGELLRVIDAPTMDLTELGRIHNVVGDFFAQVAEACIVKAVRAGKCRRSDILVIGSHGQTVWHAPEKGVSWQLGNPYRIAAHTGITVVADFRQADLVQGGEGAPFLPLYHRRVLGANAAGKAIHNLGGISNFTYFGKRNFSFALDTGPANCLIDVAVHDFTKGKAQFDRGGKFARAGKIRNDLLEQWLRYPSVQQYLRKGLPKSTGRELFSPKLAREFWAMGEKTGCSGEDTIATLTEFTVRTSVNAYERFVLQRKHALREIVLTGGGALNPVIAEGIKRHLPGTKVHSIADLGIEPQALEAQAFGYYALRTLEGQPSNVKTATGAKNAVPCGSIVPGKNLTQILRAHNLSI